MDIEISQIPHRYRNRFLRDNNGSVTTINRTSNGVNGGNNYTFNPVKLWGQYFDDTEDIKGDLENVGAIYADSSIYAHYVDTSTLKVSGLTTARDLVPEANNQYLLGYQNKKWATIWANRLRADRADVSTLIVDDASIKRLDSSNITTEYLTVTKQAHFFELIIDELRAVGGQVILSPARAKIELVEQQNNGSYICYFLAKDSDGEQVRNNFLAND